MRCPSGFNRCISANYASECNNHLYLTAAAKCESTCPDGFYRSPIHGKPIGRECPRCHEDCNKCENADACSECKNSKFLNPDLWCETDCPTGYYKVGNGEIGNTCEKCPEHCRNCLDSQTCTECMDFKYLAPSRQCVETCPTNTFHLGVAIVAPRLPVAWSATALYIWTKSSIVLKCVLMVSTPREMKIEGAAA